MASVDQHREQILRLLSLTEKEKINWAPINSSTYYFKQGNLGLFGTTITVQKTTYAGKPKFILQITDDESQKVLVDIETSYPESPSILLELYSAIETSIVNKGKNYFNTFLDSIDL